MIHLSPDLWVGSDRDWDTCPAHWYVIHAAREPHHRAFVGYKGRAAPADSPERFYAFRGSRLALNLVDVPDPTWISPQIVATALLHAGEAFKYQIPVLVHCNQGRSRSPWLAAFIAHRLNLLSPEMKPVYTTFADAEQFLLSLDPSLITEGSGMRDWVKQNW